MMTPLVRMVTKGDEIAMVVPPIVNAMDREEIDIPWRAFNGKPARSQADTAGRLQGRMVLVPRRGLEPPRLAALVPETSASTNSATWATWR